MFRIFSLAGCGVAATLLTTQPAGAQSPPTPGSATHCRTNPGAKPAPGAAPLSDKLQDCNGVLHPGAAGDPDIVKPTPGIVDPMTIQPPAAGNAPGLKTP